MRILIISSTTWDNANSFGNTFSNLFEGMENVEIYNIACRHGVSNNALVKKSVQLTDKSVLKSIYTPRFDPCWEIEGSVATGENNQEISESARKKRKTISFVIRDVIWKLGRWKKSRVLNAFLKEASPDVVYLPIYASPYMCDIQRYIVKKLKVPVVGHISDDVFGIPPKMSLLGKWYRAALRKKLKKLIAECAYLEVFAQNMKEEYSEIFDKPCYLIGKGVALELIDTIKIDAPENKQLHFVYTGNIGDDRYRALVDIGQTISEVFEPQGAVLDIYSTTPLTEEMKTLIFGCDAIKFHGGIGREEVEKVQQAADFLVHVEGFSERAIFSARMSFSTKIIDYMLMGKPILAFGPDEVNSIQTLKNHSVGLTATSASELRGITEELAKGSVNYEALTSSVKDYLIKHRNIREIQLGIYQRLYELVNRNESFTD